MTEKSRKVFIKNLTKILFVLGTIILIIGLSKYEKKYHEIFPLKLNRANMPAIEMKIDKIDHWIGIDLGAYNQLNLKKKALDNIKKKQTHPEASRDFKGNKYLSSCYEIANIEIGKIKFKQVIAKELREDYSQNTKICSLPYDQVERIENNGYIGMELVQNYNLLFDFKKNIFCISNDKKKLKKIGYNLKHFVKVPFEMDVFGIIVKVNTELGIRKFLLDTGSTLNLLKKYPCLEKIGKEKYGLKMINVSDFILGNENFKSQELFLVDLSDFLENIDGLLGVDFLQNHTSYIDFKRKILYLKK